MKSLAIVFTDAASRDLERAAAEIAVGQPLAAIRFMTSVREVLSLTAMFPEGYPIAWENLRRVVLRRYQYNVYYRIEGESLAVAAIIHGSRNQYAALKDR